jgi:muramoyltetrapeptide carboxypeptidase
MNCKGWEHLKVGDIIDVVAPASKPSKQLLEDAKTYLISKGLIPRIPEDIIDDNVEYFANNDSYRFEHLRDALLTPDSKAVWCIRGGYGSSRIVEDLMMLPKPEFTKLFIGFSDITVLHIFLQQFWGWSTIHGNVLSYMVSNKDNPQANLRTEDLVFGRIDKIVYTDLKPLNNYAFENRAIHNTTITGGNLALIQTSIGTEWHIDTKNKILIIEQVWDAAYRIDRALQHLKQAKIFEQAIAVIFGNMTAEVEKDEAERTMRFIHSFAEKLSIPAFSYENIGHNHITNEPIPLGTSCILQLCDEANNRLICKTGVNNFGYDDTYYEIFSQTSIGFSQSNG